MSIKEILEQLPKLTPEERQELRDGLAADEFPETDDMSNHLSSEIPLRTFLNACIIDRVVETTSFEKAVREVMMRVGYGSYKYEFKNPAYILGMLYGLVVVPFERHFSDSAHPIYKELCLYRGGVASLFKIDISPQEDRAAPTYWLIKHLRNSISHVRLSISLPKQDFCFWDQKPKATAPHWRCRITNEHLFVFLNALGQILAPLSKRASNIIKPAHGRGELHCVGATTSSRFARCTRDQSMLRLSRTNTFSLTNTHVPRRKSKSNSLMFLSGFPPTPICLSMDEFRSWYRQLKVRRVVRTPPS